MEKYVSVNSLWKCETCFHHQNGKCSPNIWCENGESYRPSYNKLTIIDAIDKFEAVDKFRDELMDEFLSLCNYNDYSKINLLTIGETVDRIYDKCIDDMVKEDKENKR